MAARKKSSTRSRAKKKTTGKKPSKRKAPAKKSAAKPKKTKTPAKKTSKKTAAKAKGGSPSKKPTRKADAKKADTRKAAAKKTEAKKTGARKTDAKKAAAGKSAAAPARKKAPRRRGKPKVVMATGASVSRLGTKWTCYSCGSKFYDLNREDPICPKCDTDQTTRPAQTPAPQTAQPSRRAVRPMAPLLDDDDDAVRHNEEFDMGLQEDADDGALVPEPAAELFDDEEETADED